MSKEIFRKKSIDQLQSPESLNDYIRVSNPGVWMLIASVLILLVGITIWGIFGQVENSVMAELNVEEGKIEITMDPSEVGRIQKGTEIRVKAVECQVISVEELNEPAGTCFVQVDGAFEDGVYLAEIVTERIRPISFIIH